MRALIAFSCLAAVAAATPFDDDEPPRCDILAPGEGEAWALKCADRFDGGLALSPDGKLIAAGVDDWVILIDAKTGKPTKSYELERPWNIQGLSWTPDGEYLIVATRNGVRCLDANDGEELWRGKGHAMVPPKGARGSGYQSAFGVSDGVAINGDGTQVASIRGRAKTVRILSITDGSLLTEVALGFEQSVRVRSAPDGSVFVVLAEDGPMAAVNWPDLSLRWTAKGRHEPAFAFSRSGRWLVCGHSGGSAGSVVIRDAVDGQKVDGFSPVGDFDIGGVVFLDEGKTFAAAGGGKGLNPLVIWPRSSPHRPSHVLHKNFPVEGMLLAGDRIVVAGRRDKTLRAFTKP